MRVWVIVFYNVILLLLFASLLDVVNDMNKEIDTSGKDQIELDNTFGGENEKH